MIVLLAMVTVGPAVYRPLFPASPGEKEVPVPAFSLDVEPVTNAEFLAFVQAHPEWLRGKAPLALADHGYLSAWASPTSLGGGVTPDAPVTHVSWFAAEAYCEARGAKLPTIAQWEVAAAASATRADGRDDPGQAQRILDWYAQPNPDRLPPVGQSPANFWGARDLHGLVWEWVYDFNSEMLGGGERFCGSGALGATDPGDVATSMRAEMRSSLRAEYTTPNLGFRCAQSP